ncbi:MAG: Holliday junction resolvase Hjc [Nanoarchaeota archaeon]|mgnify:CR=1 FL=1
MSNKSKGSNAERELVRIFTEHGWRALRVAGSGVNDDSPCDIIAAKMGKRGYTIEAKSSKKDRIYITKQQIEDFVLYSHMIGLQAVIAVRFNYEGWIFINPSQLEDTGKNWVVSKTLAKTQGKKFSQFFEDNPESFS